MPTVQKADPTLLTAQLRHELTQRRITLDVSQRDLADQLGIKQGQVSRMETGKASSPTLDLISAWAAALSVRITLTLEFDDPPQD